MRNYLRSSRINAIFAKASAWLLNLCLSKNSCNCYASVIPELLMSPSAINSCNDCPFFSSGLLFIKFWFRGAPGYSPGFLPLSEVLVTPVPVAWLSFACSGALCFPIAESALKPEMPLVPDPALLALALLLAADPVPEPLVPACYFLTIVCLSFL